MNFQLASSLFFFVIKAAKTLLEFRKPSSLAATNDGQILLETSGKVATAIDKIYEDKKIDLTDIPELLELLKDASAFIGFDFQNAASQIANASRAELEEAFKKFDDQFKLTDKNKEKNLEAVFFEIFSIINSANRIIKICEKIK